MLVYRSKVRFFHNVLVAGIGPFLQPCLKIGVSEEELDRKVLAFVFVFSIHIQTSAALLETTTWASPFADSKADLHISPNYEQRLLAHIKQFEFYPKFARQRGIEGEVLVRLTIATNGELISSTIEHSSGHQLLDEAAISISRRASPYPIRTHPLSAESFIFSVPLRFQLQGKSASKHPDLRFYPDVASALNQSLNE